MQANTEFGGGECKIGMIMFITTQVTAFLPPFSARCSWRGANGGGYEGANMPRPLRSNSYTKHKAIQLRRSSTPAEVKLWSRIRNEQLGNSFRRQHAIGNYIVDFCAPRKKLIIELDGSQHLEQQQYDEERTKYFEARGYRVLRFWNNDVMNNTDNVLKVIWDTLNEGNQKE
jgi:very-short-patch-repair endonuclease